MNPEFMPTVEQLARHWLTHVAEAKTADSHRVTPVKGPNAPAENSIVEVRPRRKLSDYAGFL
jgi:hypothetical protein